MALCDKEKCPCPSPTFKSFLAAWHTSSRMHELVTLPCLFCGASKNDNLAHYLQCTALWHTINIFIIKSRASYHLNYICTCAACAPSGARSSNAVMNRIGIDSDSRWSFLPLAMAYLLYHSLKMGDLQLRLKLLVEGDFPSIARHSLSHILAVSAVHFPNL